MQTNLAIFDGINALGDLGVRGLWVTDGTAAGTWEISVANANATIFNPGPFALSPGPLVSLGSEVLFQGRDANNNFALWVTDGTSPGTSELVNFFSSSSLDAIAFGSKALFAGADTGLWVTDGTGAGTSELTVSGAEPRAVSDLTVFGTEVLFSGRDTSAHYELWATDGTSSGTTELSVAGANWSGTSGASNLTVLGSEVLFTAPVSGVNLGLWVTDGTAAGTSELTVADTGGGAFGFIVRSSPFVVLGSEALFAGVDAGNNDGLWVTDGTSAGTSELTVSGTPSGGFFSVTRPNFVRFGSEVLFESNFNLWVTDGTAAGTSELTVAGETNIIAGTTPSFFVFGSEVLFAGVVRNGFGSGLWVTDGTSAGTSELTIAGAESTFGLFNHVNPGFAMFGSEVLFSGTDPQGLDDLWVTNGTGAGTSELNVSGVSPDFGLSPQDLTAFTQNLIRPVLSNVPTTDTYTERNAPTALAPSLRPTDDNSTSFTSATVAIVGGTFANDGDSLAATATGNINVTYNSSTETLTLTGSDTLADYQLVFDSITFVTPSHNPTDYGSDPTRTITWVVNDGAASNSLSAPLTTTLSITAINDPPTLSGTAATASFTEEGPALTIAGGISVSDPDDLDLANATVQFVGDFISGDRLAATTTGTNITSSYNSSTGVLTLSGSDALAHYQQVLDSVTFLATEDNPTDYGSIPTRTVSWTVNDGHSSFNTASASTTFNVINVNDPPILSVAGATASFTEEGGAVTLSPVVGVTDVDDLTLASATVAIIGGKFGGDGDVLAATTTGTSISAGYDSTTETLTLTGLDTLGDYQTVLKSVTFNAGENPTDFGSDQTRTTRWVLTDPSGTANGGTNVSAPATITIDITNVNDPPSLSNVAASASLMVLGQAITVSPALTVSDPDNLTLVGATVAITGGTFAGDGDVLAATTTGTGIAASYNPATETLTLAGTDTLAHYAQVLDSVTFTSTSAVPIRTATWILNDGSGSNNLSAPATTTISFQSIPFDLNGDGNSDLVFQNDGTPGVWLMNGTTPIAEAAFPGPGPSWHIVASRDVNGDGKADLIWQNSDGTPGIWLMNGTTPIAEAAFPGPGPSWHIVAAGDVNGDGKADLIWQNSDGTLGVWLMNGTTPIAEATIGNPGANWQVVGTADFNGDGRDDILLQDTTTGNLMIDLMNGTTVASTVSIAVGDPSWHAVSTGEFNGQAEIAWQNSNGTPAIWLMNGTTPVAQAALPNPSPAWQVVSIDHFAPNGQAGLLFQNTNGAMGLWQMNGTNIVTETGLLSPGSGWQSVNGHPFASG